MSEEAITNSGKPIQVLPWSEKIKNDREWFNKNADYYISISSFNGGQPGNQKRDIKMLYEVYNNQFPLKWFSHVTDPLSAKNPAHKAFPAKVRPVTILRTNLDLLMAEYPRRPFIYQVNNMGDDGYSRYMEGLKEKINGNLQQYFQLSLQQQLAQQGLTDETGRPISEEAQMEIQKQMDNIEYPEDIQATFSTSYRDKIAIQAQKWLNRAIVEHSIKPKFLKQMKDWLIAGEVYSYKAVEHGNLVYKRVSPLYFDHDKSPNIDFVEDGEWCVHLDHLTLSDVVDEFYQDFKDKEKDIKELDKSGFTATPQAFQSHLQSMYADSSSWNKIPVYHVQWKGKRKKGILFTPDPETGEMQEIEVDEDYKPDTSIGETVEWMWVNEVYETWKVSNLYLKQRPVPIQRNALNNFSTCKLSYNGRKFSDTHSQNISVLEIGLPFQIMYIIVTRSLELTIAKSKGKIMLIDHAAIPNGDGWDEEKFFYYAEALGYGLLNRNQLGVDKSWNQYAVLDMTLFESISQLIELQNYFKQQWDDIIGINRQRKGQTYASDLQGVNERAVFQSTVITDMIFNLFEEFTEKELQGMLDLSKFTNIDGLRKVWYETELGAQLLEINPDDYANADLGVYLDSSSEAIARKNKIEGTVQAMIQNNVRPSTVVEILKSTNIAELTEKLKKIEEIQAQVEQQNAKSEQEANLALEETRKSFMEYEMMLKETLMNAEYDRKEDIEMIRGEFNTYTFKDGDSNANGIPDVMEVEKHKLEREKLYTKTDQQNRDRIAKMVGENKKLKLQQDALALKEKDMKMKNAINKQKIKTTKSKS